MDHDSPPFATGKRHRARALRSVAYGVSSTPRGRQLPAPIVAARATGAHVFDESGARFIDHALGYGPLILGHSPAPVIAALHAELDRGLRTASVHAGEAELGELIADTLPCADLSAFVSSGSEAVHLALRVARAATGRLPVIRFRANYHGWFDTIQVAGDPSHDGPGTVGQDPDAARHLTILDWGDTVGFRAAINADFAAVILEPVAVNGGCLFPPEGFLEAVRERCTALGVMLIFDEVITGYRLSLGGAQARMGVTPDIAVIGKAMGSGLPIGAVTGTRAAMEPIASGTLFHRGTFNGNPLSVAASIACIAHLRDAGAAFYDRIDGHAARIETHARQAARDAGVTASVTRTGSAVQIFLGLPQIETLGDTAHIDRETTARFAAEMLMRGVQIIGRGLIYLSSAHTEADIDETCRAISEAFETMARAGRG